MNSLWETFNDVAEGFGLNKLEMLDICSTLQDSFNLKSRAEMDAVTSKLFLALDTDEVNYAILVIVHSTDYFFQKNGLVDALEFLGTIAMVSAMKLHQKITCKSKIVVRYTVFAQCSFHTCMNSCFQLL